MANIQLRGRVINKNTRQPISGVTLELRRRPIGSGSSVTTTPITVDADGEFDQSVTVSATSDRFELKIDKDAGYKYKVVTVSFSNVNDLSKDIGLIELEPYTD